MFNTKDSAEIIRRIRCPSVFVLLESATNYFRPQKPFPIILLYTLLFTPVHFDEYLTSIDEYSLYSLYRSTYLTNFERIQKRAICCWTEFDFDFDMSVFENLRLLPPRETE